MGELAGPLDRLARRRLGGEEIRGLARADGGGVAKEIWRFSVVQEGAETPVILRRAPGGVQVSETGIGLETEAAVIQPPRRRCPCRPFSGCSRRTTAWAWGM